VTYTPIRQVSFSSDTKGFSVFPNPTRTKVQMQFDNITNGQFTVDVINLAGQVIYTRQVKLQESNLISFNLPTEPAPGVYYLRAKDNNTQKIFSGKLIIQNH
jgi:uncharacterized protein YfaS (alpha-2-macroglobulin family)